LRLLVVERLLKGLQPIVAKVRFGAKVDRSLTERHHDG